jgi:hypothetical protein
MVDYEVSGIEISNSIIGNTCRLHFSITFFDLEFRVPFPFLYLHLNQFHMANIKS